MVVYFQLNPEVPEPFALEFSYLKIIIAAILSFMLAYFIVLLVRKEIKPYLSYRGFIFKCLY